MTNFEIKKRYWIPVNHQDDDSSKSAFDIESRLDSTDEFMPELSKSTARYYPHRLASEVKAPLCLVLLGEMGVGKTYVMKGLKEESKSSNQEFLNHSFTEFSSGLEIRSLVSEAFTTKKTLYLDGLDENQNQGVWDALKNVLEDEVKQGADWKLRLSCRSADWDQSLEAILRNVFGEENVQVVRLVPLCESDVRAAAKQAGIDGGQILTQVYDRGLVSFARLPLTLGFLFQSWKKNQNLSVNRCDLYHEGCLGLCIDHRGRKQKKEIITPEQRLDIAAAIALTLRLGGKNQICLDERQGGTGIPVKELRWCVKRVWEGASETEVVKAIDDVLTNTAIFKGDAGTRTPEHQSYIDFLAAYCLFDSGMKDDAWKKLLTREGISYPHERGVVGWLCYKDETFRQYILEKDFKTVLLSGVDCLKADEKKDLVNQLLNHVLQWQGLVGGSAYWQYYKILNYDGLKEQVQEWITDKDKRVESRKEAIMVAKENKIKGLSSVYVNIALDKSEELDYRVDAILALEVDGVESDKKHLKALLEDLSDDPEDRLKGSILRVLWPVRLVSTSELFQYLDPPKEKHVIGGLYYDFVDYILVNDLKDDELVVGLNWVAKVGRTTEWERLVNAILWKSWNLFLERSELQDPFVRVALHFLKRHIPVLVERDYYDKVYEKPSDHDERRRLLLQLIIDNIPVGEFSKLIPRLNASEWVRSVDFEFFLQSAVDATDPNIVRNCGEMSSWVFASSSDLFRTHGGFIYDCIEYHEVLSDVYRSYLGPIILNSPEADRMEKHHKDNMDFERKVAKWERRRKALELLPDVRVNMVKENLELFHNGEYTKWINIIHLLSQPKSSHLIDYQVFDLSLMKGWNLISDDLKICIRNAGWVYLKEMGEVVPEDKNYVYQKNVSAYVVLYSLYDTKNITREFRQLIAKWAPAIVHQLIFSSSEKDGIDVHQKLLKIALEEAQEVTISGFVQRIKWDSEKESEAYQLNRFDGIGCEKLYLRLLETLKECEFKKSFALSIIEKLLEWDFEPVITYIMDEWRKGDVDSKVGFTTCLVGSQYYEKVWGEIWKWIKKHPQKGVEIFRRVSNCIFDDDKSFFKLSSLQRKELYLFLELEFNLNDDYTQMDFNERNVFQIKNSLLNLFEHNGEVDELEDVYSRFPELKWLERLIARAKANKNQNLMVLYTPNNVKEITDIP